VRDILTVLRKELDEIFGERSSRRGGLIQAAVVLLVLGLGQPALAAPLWVEGNPLAIAYFGMLPSMVAATIAADAFAGERERKTLETLLATPLSENAILLGKGAASVAFALALSVVCIVCAIATVNLTASRPHLFLGSPALVAGALFGVLASASLSTGVAILVSMKVPVSRAAQQMTSLLGMVISGLVGLVWFAMSIAVTWPNVFMVELAVLGVAAGVFLTARATFRRESFFERR